MKHVTAPFLKSLGTTTSNFFTQLNIEKLTLMLLFLSICQLGVVAQTCTAPTVSDASATLPSNCTTIPTISGQSGNVFELTINPANSYTFTICFATNSAGNSQFPQAELYDDLAGTFIAETGTADANNCTTVTYTPPADCSTSDMLVYLATYSHQCISDWRDLTIDVTCEGCALTCGAPRFVAATNNGCRAAAFSIDAPAVSGSCAGSAISAVGTPAGINNRITVNADGSIDVAGGTPTGTYTITYSIEDCTGATVTCDQEVVVEPVMACDDVVNVTLSQFCEMQITPGMLLEAECAVESQYTVNILGQTDDIISEPGMYEVQIVYTPTVANSASGTFCWGFINAEDKSGPICTLENEELNVSCGEDYDAGQPTFEDCSGVASSNQTTAEYGSCGNLTFPFVANATTTIPGPDPADPAVVEFMAASFVVDRVIVNTWTATDNNGMSSHSCQQYIYIWRPSSVNPPITSITVECGSAIDQSTLAAIDPQYVPFYDNPKYGTDTDTSNDLEFTLVDNDGDLQYLPITDVDHSICKYTVSSNDELLQELCGNTEKYIREFTVLNWCTGVIVVDDVKQVIKIEDTTAPTFDDCPESDEVGGSFANPIVLNTSSSAPGECGFTGTLTPPSASDGCSEPISYSASIFTSGGTGTGYVLVSQTSDLSNSVSLNLRDYRVDFVATDDCGNTSAVCEVYYNIEDNDAPVAICDQFTTVSLTNVENGTAEICADNLDSGSYDNCGLTSRMVKRMNADDNTFAECLPVDCADAGQEMMVVLRVVDAAGNSNTCMVTVEVQDKVGPTIVCPADITVTCLESTSVENTGNVIMNASSVDGINGYAFDNCNINAVNHTDISNTVDCGSGTIEREFTAFTNTGVATCVQTITVEPDYGYFVTFPADVTITDCGDSANTDSVGEPIISGVACGDIGIAVSDQTFVISSGACNRIVRTYIIQNTCIDGTPADATDGGIPVDGEALKFQDDGDGYFKYTQNIDIVDSEGPVFGSCSDRFFETFSNDCTGNVNVDLSATDNCASNLTYFWKVDLYSDGSDDEFGSDDSIVDVYPVGTHTAFAEASDGCGNKTQCTFTITVSDVKNPTPFCNAGVNTVIMNGDARSVTIWASDLIQQGSSFDNCTASENLVVTASLATNPNPTAPASATNIVITCDDMIRDANGNALPTSFAIQVYVQDMAGNWDFCTSNVEVIDTENDCGTTGSGSSATISGRIFNELDEDVEEVMVEVASPSMSMNPFLTDVDGEYEFDNLVMNSDYSIQPSKDVEPENGVTTFDLVLMTRHILGLSKLDSPYKIIAADVNGDRALDINDLLEVRQLILYASTGFSSQKSWTFIDANYQFVDPTDPFGEAFPQVIDFTNLTSDEAGNFIGVKLGDLDGDAYANRLLDVTPRSFYPTTNLELNDAELSAGEAFSIPFSTVDMDNMSALQFTVEFDQNAVEFAGVNAGALNVSESNFGFTMMDEGIITFSWNSFSGKVIDTKAQSLFTLDFVAKQETSIAEAISLGSKYTSAVAYNDNGQYNINFNFVSEDGVSVAGEGFELYQNTPNPFRDNTVIGFNLPEAASATLRIMDVTGKELRVISDNYSRGFNQVNLDLNTLDVKGVLYYQLETSMHADTKKMIVIE